MIQDSVFLAAALTARAFTVLTDKKVISTRSHSPVSLNISNPTRYHMTTYKLQTLPPGLFLVNH